MTSLPTSRHGSVAGMVPLLLVVVLAGCGIGEQPAERIVRPAESLIGIVTRLGLGAEHGAVFYAYDSVVWPDTLLELRVLLSSVKKLDEVTGATIEFSRDGQPIGRAVTDEEGFATINWRTPGQEGNYLVHAKIVAVPDKDLEELLQTEPRELLIAVLKRETRLAVIDIDHTITNSNWARVLMGSPQPMAGAADALNELAGKYKIVYLTLRPEQLMVSTKRFLKEHGFPPGPVLMSTFDQSFSSNEKMKSLRIHSLRLRFPNVVMGVGDKLSDMRAYLKNGLAAYLIPQHREDDPGEIRGVARQVAEIKEDVQVADDWAELRLCMGGKLDCRPPAAAQRLLAKADRVAQENRQKAATRRAATGPASSQTARP